MLMPLKVADAPGDDGRGLVGMRQTRDSRSYLRLSPRAPGFLS